MFAGEKDGEKDMALEGVMKTSTVAAATPGVSLIVVSVAANSGVLSICKLGSQALLSLGRGMTVRRSHWV